MEHIRLGTLTLAGLLLAGSPAATAGQVPSFEALGRALKPGDRIEVTLWSGRGHKGQFAGVTPCSLVLTTRAERVELDGSEIRRVKQLSGAARAKRSGRLADSGKSCEGAPCMAMSLALAGGSAVSRGVAAMFSRSKTLYAVSAPVPPQAGCRPRVAIAEARSR